MKYKSSHTHSKRSVMPDPSLTAQDVLGPDGLLAGLLHGFEFRSSQMDMALIIQKALVKKVPAIVEAGTGTGKTFGYLVPVVLSGKKAVISTGTKNLQEQIYFKDLPILRRATDLKIDAMIMKGRKNYLCLHKYNQYFSQPSMLNPGMADKGQRLREWMKKTEFADRAELRWMADDDFLWDAISSTSEQCLGADCMFLNDCFLGRLRAKAAKSRIIIVNHHLFFADLKIKRGGFGEILPRFQVAVFDEAHNIEEIATSYLGEALSMNQVFELVGDIEKVIRDTLDSGVDKRKLKKYLNSIKSTSEGLRALFDNREDKGRIDHNTMSLMKEGPAREIRRSLENIRVKTGISESENGALQQLVARADDLDRLFQQVLKDRDDNWLNWYEKQRRGVTLHASPLDISERMNELLYLKVQTVVFTSATLSTNGTFDYIASRLGLSDDTIKGISPSHFDFENQTLLYIPKDLPLPNDSGFGPQIAIRILDILKRTNGRALVLFTSYYNLNIVYEILKHKIPYTIFRQGDAPRSVLLDSFRKDIRSILLATRSFWQGVDVPGEALSCLIIDKLPFDSPGEPLIAARLDAIRSSGGNPFMDYQVPSAIISLKQGLGRLIRKSSDRGLLSILDIRILKSRYASLFLESLPRIHISHDLSDITHFLK
ncbi:MAG: ATP-dependent DNA helicase [Thermodesulfobacteriota bacterium]|nr:ATP-dependent DNA helicase [Thermodesulfobacteriota bacterium]